MLPTLPALMKCSLKLKNNGAKQGALEPAAENNGGSLKDALKDPEKNIILDAIQKCGGNKKEAAKLLGINRTTLYKKISQYGIVNKK